MQEYIICSDGRKRKAIRIQCEWCSKEKLVRIEPKKNKAYKFCTRQCFFANRNKEGTIQVECAWCKNQLLKKKSRTSKSGLFFCNRKCKESAQKIGGIKEIQPNHYDNGSRINYRKQFNNDELICSRCGYNEFAVGVEIHHIDKDRTNNDKSNLIPLCANCHAALHNEDWQFEEILNI